MNIDFSLTIKTVYQFRLLKPLLIFSLRVYFCQGAKLPHLSSRQDLIMDLTIPHTFIPPKETLTRSPPPGQPLDTWHSGIHFTARTRVAYIHPRREMPFPSPSQTFLAQGKGRLCREHIRGASSAASTLAS